MTSAVRTLLVTLGSALAALGAVLTARPFTTTDALVALTLAALGGLTLGQLLGSERPWAWTTRLSAITWLTAALVIGTQQGIDVATVAVVVGAALTVDGALGVIAGIRDTAASQGSQFARITFGLAGIVLGVLLLATPAPTVLSVAVVLGARVLWFGLAVFWSGVRGTFDEAEPFQPGSLRRITTTVASGTALVLALTLATASYWVHEGPADELGALRIPAEVPDRPGALISAEEFDDGIPFGTRAWRILYTTTRDEGVPALSTALVLAREDLPAGPRPVLAWAHGTTGTDTRCAPSKSPGTLALPAIPGLSQALTNDWVVVATDYIGLGTPGPHPYLIGQGEGRSVLDSVRAARELDDLDLSPTTVAWGHSQGGGAALWAGILGPRYAPEVDLVGVAGIAPASDLNRMVDTITSVPAGAIFAAYVIDAYAAAYPDVDVATYIRPSAREPMRRFAEYCLADQREMAAIAQDPAFAEAIYAASPNSGALARRLRQNTPSGPIAAPVLIAQGAEDPLVLPDVQSGYVAARCQRTGDGPLDYRTYPGRDHTNIIHPSSAMVAELVSWSEDRFAGVPARSTC